MISLKATIQNKNRDQLVDLMKVMEDDKVELLSEVMSKEDAVKKLGLTQQQYQEYLKYEQKSL